MSGATTSGLFRAPEYSPKIPIVGPYASPPFANLGKLAKAANTLATAATARIGPTIGILDVAAAAPEPACAVLAVTSCRCTPINASICGITAPMDWTTFPAQFSHSPAAPPTA